MGEKAKVMSLLSDTTVAENSSTFFNKGVRFSENNITAIVPNATLYCSHTSQRFQGCWPEKRVQR